jgi:hypothetical protein
LPAASLRQYRLFQGHLGYRLADFVGGQMLYMTFLRDPVEQVISNYEFIRRNSRHYMGEKVRRECPTLDAFVNHPEFGTASRNPQLFHFHWDSQLIPSLPTGVTESDTLYIQEAHARLAAIPRDVLLARTRRRLERFAFVGLVDRMEESLRLLAYTFGWEPFPEAPKLNAAGGDRARKEDLPRATLERIRELTELDGELYAYGQQLFESRLREMERGGSLARRMLARIRGWVTRRAG